MLPILNFTLLIPPTSIAVPSTLQLCDDGEVTKAKMDNNEVCMCVISVVCIIMLVIVSNRVQTVCNN